MKINLAIVYFFVSMLIAMLTNFFMAMQTHKLLSAIEANLTQINDTVIVTDARVEDIHSFFDNAEVEIQILTE